MSRRERRSRLAYLAAALVRLHAPFAGLEIRILTARMIRGVEHCIDGWHRLLDGDFDALFERDVRHAATLATPFESNEDGIALHIDEGDMAAVHRDRRVHFLIEHMLDRTPLWRVEPRLGNGIEVIYNSVILVLKGVSLKVPKGGITALLGGNGAGKTTTPKAVSNLLHSERGEVTKGSIKYRDEPVHRSDPADMVKRGVVQVMEGRHCFEHLTIEENLLTGAYTRSDGKAAIARDLEMVYEYFPRLRERRKSQAGYTSGGEQQMCAIGRALMSRPETILLDEPSMGLAPQLVEQIFEIVKSVNENEGVTFLLAEQNKALARRLANNVVILETGHMVFTGTFDDLDRMPELLERYLSV